MLPHSIFLCELPSHTHARTYAHTHRAVTAYAAVGGQVRWEDESAHHSLRHQHSHTGRHAEKHQIDEVN